MYGYLWHYTIGYHTSKGMLGIEFGVIDPAVKIKEAKKKKINLVSGLLLMYKCKDSYEIISQGSLPEKRRLGLVLWVMARTV